MILAFQSGPLSIPAAVRQTVARYDAFVLHTLGEDPGPAIAENGARTGSPLPEWSEP
ncbi:hypothetical protein ACQEVC_38475 [Plantactinospora sp. CA-294935]|uniref:hypothetical protein n=1 Tax=Plantactinospora sp. CA-294935 TaxID=3240012 RepID=UPI003D90673A